MKANLHQNIRIPSKMTYNFIWFEIINNESKLVMLSMNLHGVGNLLMHPFLNSLLLTLSLRIMKAMVGNISQLEI